MGVMENYAAGIGNQGSYMVSGQPFITGSAAMVDIQEDKISFPFVTKKFTIISSGTVASPIIRISFVSTGSTSNSPLHNKHYIQLDGDEESFTFNCKCKEVFISTIKANSGYQLYAELTRIGANQMYALTGSGIDT
jgi:hypothetical protein